jgi:adenylate kinase
MLNIIIFGAPGSGKGTQSSLVKEKYNLIHISTGDLIREEIRQDSETGRLVKEIIERGELIPDDIVCDMIDNVLNKENHAKGVIFDGFPRTSEQAIILDEILKKRNESISIVLDLQAKDEVLVNRLLERGKISGRSDDNAKTIQSRLKVYYDQTAPLADYYAKQNKRVVIDGIGSIENIFTHIDEELQKICK